MKKGDLLTPGSEIKITGEVFTRVLPNSTIPIKILDQTDNWIAVEKPNGINTYPLKFKEDNTVANFVVSIHPDNQNLKPLKEAGVCHRLDSETSGILLFGKNKESCLYFRNAFKTGEMQKYYTAITERSFPKKYLGPHTHLLKPMGKSGKLMACSSDSGQRAELNIESIEHNSNSSTLRIKLITGVRHQIRVQLAQLGYPILGDPLYSHLPQSYKRMFLHHGELSGISMDGKTFKVICTPPKAFTEV